MLLTIAGSALAAYAFKKAPESRAGEPAAEGPAGEATEASLQTEGEALLLSQGAADSTRPASEAQQERQQAQESGQHEDQEPHHQQPPHQQSSQEQQPAQNQRQPHRRRKSRRQKERADLSAGKLGRVVKSPAVGFEVSGHQKQQEQRQKQNPQQGISPEAAQERLVQFSAFFPDVLMQEHQQQQKERPQKQQEEQQHVQ